MPSLSTNDLMLLPGGGLVVGTGGVGDMGYATADASQLLGLPVGVGDAVADAPLAPRAPPAASC